MLRWMCQIWLGKAQKEVALLWSIIHKAVAVNEWCWKISTYIDKCCPHCGPQSVESVEHRFFSCSLAQQGLLYAAHIMWQSLAKRGTLACGNLSPWCNAIFYQPLCKVLKRFNCIWFFLRSAIPWIIWRQRNDRVFNTLQWPVERTRQVIWDTL